jgi:hypothetical protein
MEVHMKKTYLTLVCVLAAAMVGCSEAPKTETKTEAKKAPEPVTGQSALWKMFQVARAWSGDVQVLKMNSINLSEVPSVPGKAGAWEATFVSSAKGAQKSWTFSVVEAQGNLHEGVFQGPQSPWSPTSDAPVFPIAGVKKDTDAALEAAKAKVAEAAKKNEGKPITFLLEATKKYPDPVWRVVWGESVGTSNLSVYIDATTGLWLETLH